jgi:hypothetical protein
MPSKTAIFQVLFSEEFQIRDIPTAVNGKIGDGTLSAIVEGVPKVLFRNRLPYSVDTKSVLRSCNPAMISKLPAECLYHNSWI